MYYILFCYDGYVGDFLFGFIIVENNFIEININCGLVIYIDYIVFVCD